jgi:hypothetical protein
MTWHYAAGGERHGPVDDAELDRLIAAGAVTGDTPVWYPGLDGWRPLREARTSARLAEAVRSQPVMAAAVVPARPRPDADADYARLHHRRLAPLSAIQRGAALVFAQPGPTIGVSALIMVMMMAAGFVPCIGGLVQIAIVGPLVAAWYGYFLKHIRGQPALLEDVFAVFSSPDLIHMIAVHVIVTVISVVLILPIAAIVFFTMIGTAAATAAAANGDTPLVVPAVLPVVALGMLLVVAAMLYVNMAFMFAPALILDRGHAFWPAMRLSQRIVNGHLLPIIALVLLAALIWLAGLLALCLGIFLAAPVVVASFACAYEDLFGAEPA